MKKSFGALVVDLNQRAGGRYFAGGEQAALGLHAVDSCARRT